MNTKSHVEFDSNVMNLTEENDAFDFTSHAVPDLKEAILNFSDQRPNSLAENKSFGIYGKWGAGKTTLLKRVFEEIEDERPELIVVKIDLWKFELYPNDLEVITEEIVNKIFKYGKTLKWVKKFAQLILSAALNIPDINSWTKLALNQLKNYLSTEPDANPSKRMQKLQKDLKDKKILIVFDDLDRCSDNKIEFYLNYIKHVIASLSKNIKTIIVLDYQYVKDILFKEHDKAINFFKKIISKNFRIEEYLNPTLSKEEIDSWLDQDVIKDLHWVFQTPRDRKMLLDKSNEIFDFLIERDLIKPEWEEIMRYFTFFLVCLNNDIEEYSNLKLTRFINRDLAEHEIVVKGISKALNNYMGNNFDQLNKFIPLNFNHGWKATLFTNVLNSFGEKYKDFQYNENLLKSEIGKLKFKKNSYLLVNKSNNDNKLDVLNYYFGGYSYSDTSNTIFEKPNNFIDFDLLMKKNDYVQTINPVTYTMTKEWNFKNLENIFEVNKENKFLFNKANKFNLLSKVQLYFNESKINFDLLNKYNFLVKKINWLCLNLSNTYWNLAEWEELKLILTIVTKHL